MNNYKTRKCKSIVFRVPCRLCFALSGHRSFETNSTAATFWKFRSDALVWKLKNPNIKTLLWLVAFFRQPRCRCRASWTVWFTPGDGPTSPWPSWGRAPHWWGFNRWPSSTSRWKAPTNCTLGLYCTYYFITVPADKCVQTVRWEWKNWLSLFCVSLLLTICCHVFL